MARPPKTFKLVNYSWDVRIVEQDTLDAILRHSYPPGSSLGVCRKQEQTILICRDQSKQELPRTVLHEALHACFIHNKILDHSKEEEVVLLLEERLTDLIKNNPKLIKYLQENL